MPDCPPLTVLLPFVPCDHQQEAHGLRPVHHPAVLAKKAAALDEISGGRLVLGFGAGWNEPEYRAFGFPFDHRFERFEEAFTIIRSCSAHHRPGLHVCFSFSS